MDDVTPRLRAVCDLNVAEAREFAGRHEYDGAIQDLSPGGVRKALAALAEAAGSGQVLEDPHDEAHLAAFEDQAATPCTICSPWTWRATTVTTHRRRTGTGPGWLTWPAGRRRWTRHWPHWTG
jgi:hypothetical protein